MAKSTADVVAEDDEVVERRTVSIYFPVDLLAEVDEIAREQQRSRTFVIQQFVAAGIERRQRKANREKEQETQ